RPRSSVPHRRWPSCPRHAIIHAIRVPTRVGVRAVGSLAPRDSCEGVRANHKPKHAAAHERNPSFPPIPPSHGAPAPRLRPPPAPVCPRPRRRSVSRDRPRPAILRAQSLEDAGAASEPRRENLVSSSAGVEEDLQQKDPVVGERALNTSDSSPSHQFDLGGTSEEEEEEGMDMDVKEEDDEVEDGRIRAMVAGAVEMSGGGRYFLAPPDLPQDSGDRGDAPASASGSGSGSRRSRPAEEKERTKLRERHRRAITGRILAGLRRHGNYNLRVRADINEVIAALAREAGWVVLPDGTTFPSSQVSLSLSPPPPSFAFVFCFQRVASIDFDGSTLWQNRNLSLPTAARQPSVCVSQFHVPK
ncbi:hypothetical protein GW17_00048639, partial [Ensete ventricosum]